MTNGTTDSTSSVAGIGRKSSFGWRERFRDGAIGFFGWYAFATVIWLLIWLAVRVGLLVSQDVGSMGATTTGQWLLLTECASFLLYPIGLSLLAIRKKWVSLGIVFALLMNYVVLDRAFSFNLTAHYLAWLAGIVPFYMTGQFPGNFWYPGPLL